MGYEKGQVVQIVDNQTQYAHEVPIGTRGIVQSSAQFTRLYPYTLVQLDGVTPLGVFQEKELAPA